MTSDRLANPIRIDENREVALETNRPCKSSHHCTPTLVDLLYRFRAHALEIRYMAKVPQKSWFLQIISIENMFWVGVLWMFAGARLICILPLNLVYTRIIVCPTFELLGSWLRSNWNGFGGWSERIESIERRFVIASLKPKLASLVPPTTLRIFLAHPVSHSDDIRCWTNIKRRRLLHCLRFD